MTHAILTVEEFLAAFHIGDTFWHMRRFLGEPPSGIEGPCKIMSLLTGANVQSPIVTFIHYPPRNGGREEVKTMLIADVVGPEHGAFTDEKDAHAYLVDRRHAYANDPELIAHLEDEWKRREEAKGQPEHRFLIPTELLTQDPPSVDTIRKMFQFLDHAEQGREEQGDGRNY